MTDKAKIKGFKCRRLGCSGVTPYQCIRRQVAKFYSGFVYPECQERDGIKCVQGQEIMDKHPDLKEDALKVQERRRHGGKVKMHNPSPKRLFI